MLGSGWDETFPGLEPHLLTLLIQFWIPGHRELGYWLVYPKRQRQKDNVEPVILDNVNPTSGPHSNPIPGLEAALHPAEGWRTC